MTGLIDTFGRHFAVLTNFIEYVMESRPYGQEAAFLGSQVQGGPGDRPGPAGVVPGSRTAAGSSEHTSPPLQPPAGASGPASLGSALSSSKAWLLGGYPV